MSTQGIDFTSRTRQVGVPSTARTLSTLPRLDYEDAFLVESAAAQERTAEQWARATLEGAPEKTRRTLRWGWFALGLRLGSTRDARRVLGWEVRRSSPDVALLAASSPLGLTGEVLFQRRDRKLLFATFLQLRNPLARLLWARVAPGHRLVVRKLLERARQG